MKRFLLHLTEVQTTTLRTISNATGLSVAELVRRAVDAYLEDRERKEKKKR